MQSLIRGRRQGQGSSEYVFNPPRQKRVIAETSPLSLEQICCSNNPYEFTHRPRNYQTLSALSKVKGCCSCFETLSVLLTEIVNRSLATGSIPQGLKTALQIRPLLTKGNLDSWEDHCPIFFVSIWLLREQSVYNLLKLMTLVKPFNRLTTVFTVHEDILRAIDNNKSVALLLLDRSDAFDQVDLEILLHRLAFCFSIEGSALSWFQSYLGSSLVSVRGESSSWVNCVFLFLFYLWYLLEPCDRNDELVLVLTQFGWFKCNYAVVFTWFQERKPLWSCSSLSKPSYGVMQD